MVGSSPTKISLRDSLVRSSLMPHGYMKQSLRTETRCSYGSIFTTTRHFILVAHLTKLTIGRSRPPRHEIVTKWYTEVQGRTYNTRSTARPENGPAFTMTSSAYTARTKSVKYLGS